MRTLSYAEVTFAVLLLGSAGVLLAPALTKTRCKADRTRCSNNLRQLGLASVQYADDKRFFPHLGELRELDGDWTSPDGPAALRALVYYGYLDDVETFVCPESLDAPASSATLLQLGDAPTWDWRGRTSAPDATSPWTHLSATNSTEALSELSYGYTRRMRTSATRCIAPLAADRSLRVQEDPTDTLPAGDFGNHSDGVNVVYSDASVSFVTRYDQGISGSRFASLTATQRPDDGYLGVKPYAAYDFE